MLTRHRINVVFFRGPVKGPNAWRGKNRAQAEWTLDVFKNEAAETVAVRCYKSTIHGYESRLQDGWLTKTPDGIQQRREEIGKLLKSNYVRATREPASDFDGATRELYSVDQIRL